MFLRRQSSTTINPISIMTKSKIRNASKTPGKAKPTPVSTQLLKKAYYSTISNINIETFIADLRNRCEGLPAGSTIRADVMHARKERFI
jgi:hypothetical protein